MTVPAGRPNAANGRALLQRARSRPTLGLQSAARRVMLMAGARGRGEAIEVTEAGRARRLGSGEIVAEATVHDARTYEALLLHGSVGLGASYVAGWWDSDDLTALVRVLFRRTRPIRSRLDRIGAALGKVLDPL